MNQLDSLGDADIRLLFDVLFTHQVRNVSQYIGSLVDYESNFPFKSFYAIYAYYLKYGDIRLLFDVLFTHQVRNVSQYIGSLVDYESNFPFKSFYAIYAYYLKYGLYHEMHTITKPGLKGKIDWKDTIRKSNTVISENNLIYLPLYSKEIRRNDVFLGECMAFAIGYTLRHYSLFISGRFPTINLNQFNFFANKEYTLARLKKVYTELFKDIDKKLVRDLIEFYSLVPEGGNITIKHYNFELIWESIVEKYLNTFFKGVNKKLVRDLIEFYSLVPEGGNITIKHYNFELIWESIVEKYLNTFFKGVNQQGLVFSNQRVGKSYHFKKAVFHVDKAHPNHRLEPDHYYNNKEEQFIFDSKYYSKVYDLNHKRLEPDHYYNDKEEQFVFDSKYYSKVYDLNHKQVAYYTFLKNQAQRTYNALIIPTEKESSPLPTPLHFELDPDFYIHEGDQIKIWEYYLNIADAMRNYIK